MTSLRRWDALEVELFNALYLSIRIGALSAQEVHMFPNIILHVREVDIYILYNHIGVSLVYLMTLFQMHTSQ